MQHNCPLTQLPDGKWWCPVPGCDPKKRRLLPGDYRRNCRATRREQFEADIATDVSENTRTMNQIGLTLDKCFGGCRYMKRWCTRRGARQMGEQYQAWIEHLLENDCTPE